MMEYQNERRPVFHDRDPLEMVNSINRAWAYVAVKASKKAYRLAVEKVWKWVFATGFVFGWVLRGLT